MNLCVYTTHSYTNRHINAQINRHRNKYKCMHIAGLGYTHTHVISQLHTLREPRSSDTLVTMNTCSTRSLVSKYHSPIERTRVPWGNG